MPMAPQGNQSNNRELSSASASPFGGSRAPAEGQDFLTQGTVIEKELAKIVTRRNIAFPGEGSDKAGAWTEKEVANDLVGLALSGGGIRSAMFNMGFLQSLHASGLLRYVDYLSTVSGGSYIAAYFSSHMLQLLKEQEAAERKHAERQNSPSMQEPRPIQPEGQGTGGRSERPNAEASKPIARSEVLRRKFGLQKKDNRAQPWRVLEFIRRGTYLNRPGELTAQYLAGL